VCLFFANGFAHADIIYVTTQGDTIEKFDSSVSGSVFASGLVVPTYIAAQVPEPATWTSSRSSEVAVCVVARRSPLRGKPDMIRTDTMVSVTERTVFSRTVKP
jgi:hypothetical protein